MKKTIFGKEDVGDNHHNSPPNEQSVETMEVSSSNLVVAEPDGLDWLNKDLPDLSTVSHHQFDLELEFDIKWYLDILADEATGVSITTFASAITTSKVDGTGSASTFIPEPSE